MQLLLVQLVLAHAPTTWKAPDGHIFQHFLLQSRSLHLSHHPVLTPPVLHDMHLAVPLSADVEV